MPAVQPAASPRLSCSTSVTAGKRSRTKAAVPSLEPLSTTTVGSPRTLSRQRSSHGSASYVTTTTPTSAGSAMARPCPGAAAHALPEQDERTGDRQRDGDEEEQEPGRERLLRPHAQLPQEAHEERLAHG